MTSKDRKKASNGSGSVERRRDRDGVLTWWARVALPRVQGEKLHCKRIPIPNSELMTEVQARRAAEVLAEKVRIREIVFDQAPKGTAGEAGGSELVTVGVVSRSVES